METATFLETYFREILKINQLWRYRKGLSIRMGVNNSVMLLTQEAKLGHSVVLFL